MPTQSWTHIDVPLDMKLPGMQAPSTGLSRVFSDTFTNVLMCRPKTQPAPLPVVFDAPLSERYPTLAALGFVFDASASSLVCPTCGGDAHGKRPDPVFRSEYMHNYHPRASKS